MIFGEYIGWPGTIWIARALHYLNTVYDPEKDIRKHDFEQEFIASLVIKTILHGEHGCIKDKVLYYNGTQGSLWRALFYISQNMVT